MKWNHSITDPWIAIPMDVDERYVWRTRRKKIGDRIVAFRSKRPREDPNHSFYEWHKMPDDVYLHKLYPTCTQCQQKFVPIERGDSVCFKCKFTSR